MVTGIVMWSGLLITVVALVCLPLFYRKPTTQPRVLARIAVLLLWAAGILSCWTTLLALAAGAWGMDTRVPWGLGVYMYLVPALSLPAFLLLLVSSLPTFSRVLWCLTLACAFAWSFGDEAGRRFSKLPPISDP